MTKKRKRSLLFIIIGVLVLILGVAFWFLKPPSIVRDYKGVVDNQEENNFSKITIKDFSKTLKSIGYEETICEEDQHSKNTTCYATNKSYSKRDFEDSVSLIYDEKENIESLYMFTYYLKKDFKVDKVDKDLNVILKNFFGYEVPIDTIDNLNNELEKEILSSEDDVTVSTKATVGDYNVEIILECIKSMELYQIKVYIE